MKGARWNISQPNGAHWASPTVAFQGEAIQIVGTGSTSLFPNTANPVSGRADFTVGSIGALSFDMLLDAGSCSAGSPRFQINYDTNNDGIREQLTVYPPTGWTCPAVGTWTHVDMWNGRWNSAQFGGPSSGTIYDAMATPIGDDRIISINLVWDGPSGSAWFDNVRVHDFVFREHVDETNCIDYDAPSCAQFEARPNTIVDGAMTINGDWVSVHDFTLRNTDVSSATNRVIAVDVHGDDVQLSGNAILGNGPRAVQSTRDSPEFGVYLRGQSFDLVMNDITQWAHTGVYVAGGNDDGGRLFGNVITQNRASGVYLEDNGGVVTLENNDLTQNAQSGIRVDGRPFVAHENFFGVSDATISFFTPSVPTIDARFNHWGAFDRPSILATIKDDPASGAGSHVVNIDCYYGADGEQVCPPVASFTASTLAPTRDQPVTFTSTSTPGDRPTASTTWTFTDLAPATGSPVTRSWATSGPKVVTLTVTDDEGGSSTATQTIGVLGGDRAPSVAPIAAKVISETQSVSVLVTGSDPDGDAFTLSASPLPSGATFETSGDKGWINWTTTAGQAGVYDIGVTATNALSSTTNARITVKFLAAMTLTRVTPATVTASPLQTKTIDALLTNTGPNTDTFTVTVTGDRHYAFGPTSSTVTLAPGASTTVSYTVTTPADWYFGVFQLRVVSQGDANANKNLLTSVDTPVNLVVTMNDTRLSLTGQNVTGRVTATHLDGTPYVGALATVRVQGSTPLDNRFPGSTTTVTTGANGVAFFNFGTSPIDRTPGRHYVSASVPRAGATAVQSNEAHYNILT